jgi:hypothetical protein
MLNTCGRLKLLAPFSGRIARVLPAMLPRRCLHRLQPPSWPTLNRRRALVLLASGVASFAACGSLHSFNSLPECALIGPSPLPPSTTADEASHFSSHSAQHYTLKINDTSPLTIAKVLEQLGVFFKRCRDATVMVCVCCRNRFINHACLSASELSPGRTVCCGLNRSIPVIFAIHT